MCGYYAAYSARILAANYNQSPQALRRLLNDRRLYEQQMLFPGRSLVRQSRNYRNGISYLVGSEVEDIVAGGRNRDITGNIIVYGTGRNDSDLRALALIDQFQLGLIDHLVYVVTTRNADSHWITVLVRRNQNNQVELVVTDSLGRDRSNEQNMRYIYKQFTSKSSKKRQKDEGVSVSSYIDPVDGIEVINLRDEDICDYNEESSQGKKKRKRNLKQFVREKKWNPDLQKKRKRKPEDFTKKKKRKRRKRRRKKPGAKDTSDDPADARRFERKKINLQKQINNPSIIQDESIHKKLPLLYDHNPYKDVFNGCKNSVLDKKYHEKLISINNQTSQLLERSKHNVLTQSNADIIYCFTSLAKLQKDPEVAKHLFDFCNYFAQGAQAQDAAFVKVAKTLTRGTILGVSNNLRYTTQVWKKRLTDPVGAFKDELIAYKKAGEALGRALSLAVTDPQTFGTKTYQKLSSIIRGSQDDPEQFVATIVSILLPTDPLGNKFKNQFSQGLKSAFKKQRALAAKVLKKKGPKRVERSINSLEEVGKHANQGMQKPLQKVGKGIEQILPRVKTYEQARNKALEIIGDMGIRARPFYGSLKVSKGYGKIVGRQSYDKKVRWRLDWDQNKGIHINIEDFRLGKGRKATKIAIPFDGDESTFISLLKHLNK